MVISEGKRRKIQQHNPDLIKAALLTHEYTLLSQPSKAYLFRLIVFITPLYKHKWLPKKIPENSILLLTNK